MNDESIKAHDSLILQHLENLASMLAVSGYTCYYSGLSYGKMGVVVFLFHYARQTRNTFFKKAAEKLIDEIQVALHFDFSVSYANGLTGIGTAIEYLAQHGFVAIETDDILDDFDQMFAEMIHK